MHLWGKVRGKIIWKTTKHEKEREEHMHNAATNAHKRKKTGEKLGDK